MAIRGDYVHMHVSALVCCVLYVNILTHINAY